MRLEGKRKRGGILEGDMTPMIDMTFQLIAFFMVLVNFSEADQNERIKLPSSELAKPPDGPVSNPITLQITRKGDVLFGGREFSSMSTLKSALQIEKQHLSKMRVSLKKATVIIRAHIEAKTGDVQLVIATCQEIGFEKFALRAKQQDKEP